MKEFIVAVIICVIAFFIMVYFVPMPKLQAKEICATRWLLFPSRINGLCVKYDTFMYLCPVNDCSGKKRH